MIMWRPDSSSVSCQAGNSYDDQGDDIHDNNEDDDDDDNNNCTKCLVGGLIF